MIIKNNRNNYPKKSLENSRLFIREWIKYKLADWLSQYIPRVYAAFIAVNIAAPFCDFWHLSKLLWVICFCLSISLSLKGIIYFFFYSILFSVLFPLIKYLYDKKK
jgi:hypothetical protein